MVLSFFAQSGSDGGHSCGGQCVYLIPGNAVVFHATGKWTFVGGSREVEIQESGRVTFSECSVLSLPTPVGRFFPFCLIPSPLLRAGSASARASPLELAANPIQAVVFPPMTCGRPWRMRLLAYKNKAIEDI